MDRVAGEEYAAFAVVVREEQVLLPLAHVEHVVFHGPADGPLELPRHVLVLADDRVERPVPSRILHDQERRRIVGDMVMPPFPGTVADRDALVEIVAAVQRLAKLQEVAFAAQTDAELVPYSARAAVAANEIAGAQARDRTGAVADPRRHAGRVLLERQEFAAVAQRHAWQRLRHGLEQGLQGVLGNELIRLERHRAVGAGVDLALGFGHRRIRQAQQGRLVHRQDHVDIHRHIAVQPGSADLPGEPHAPEDFHRAGVAALHLGEELRRFLALDQRAAHAFLAEIDGERQSDRPGADDQDLGIRSHARYYLCGEPGRPDPGASRPQDRRRSSLGRDSPDGGPRLPRAGPALGGPGRRSALRRGVHRRFFRADDDLVRLRLRRRRARAPGGSQPPLVAAGACRHRIDWHRADRSAALCGGAHGRDRVRLALLSASRALGGHGFDPAMGAARLGAGRLSPLDARKHRLGPARDHDAGRQMSFLLPALMLAGLAVALFSGLPVAVVLIGVAFLFAGLGIPAGSVRIEEMGAIFHRVYGTLSDRDEVLFAAVPMLLFMGAVLHESRLAADLLAGAARLFGRVRGGPALATLAVAAIQAPAAGMVGASTGALALYALPALRRHGYGTQEAAGLVAAAGTLGVVAPPGIMLFFVADAIGAQGPALFLPLPGPLALLLVLYFPYAVVRGSPVRPFSEVRSASTVDALVPAALMIGLVVIVALGYATISEAAGLAGLGAVLAAVARGRMSWSALDAAIRRTALVSAMIFFIFVGASVFSLVFRLLGGQAMISAAATALGYRGALSLAGAMIFVFVLGFFLDWLEIVVIALPAFASAPVAAGGGAQFGNAPPAARWLRPPLSVQPPTPFLTPPFGYALFLVHGATGGAVTIPQVWRGPLPDPVLQPVPLVAVAVIPELATWLPAPMLDLSVPKGPKFNE